MFDIIRKSILSILDLYREKGRSYFNFCFAFILLAVLLSAVLASLVCIAAELIFTPVNGFRVSELPEFLLEAFAGGNAMYVVQHIMFFFYGLAAIYLFRQNDEKPGVKKMLRSITPATGWTFFVLLLVYCVICILTYHDVFTIDQGYSRSLNDLFNAFGVAGGKNYSFYTWLNSFIQLIVAYLPFLFVVIMIIGEVQNTTGRPFFSVFKRSILPVLILGFCLVSIDIQLSAFLRTYLFDLIKIPFKGNLVWLFFEAFVGFVFGALIALAYAGILLYPVVHAAEAITTREEETEDASSTEENNTNEA